MVYMMSRAGRSLSAVALVAASVLTLAACGSGNPAGPSGEGVSVRGMVLDQGAASAFVRKSTSGASAQAAADAITVTVQEDPSITASVGDDGSFTLRGLPEGNFTLVFKSASGAVLGVLPFSQVKPNQEITITVQVTAGGLVVVEERAPASATATSRSRASWTRS